MTVSRSQMSVDGDPIPAIPTAEPSGAGRRVFDLISNAYYEGFVEATKHEPWDDMFDWAALKGQAHAQAALSPEER